jgi:hypothetical protein
MRPLPRLLSLLLVVCSVGASGGAGASILTLSGSNLSLEIRGLVPPVVFPQNNTGVMVSVSSGSGGFTEPAGIFTGSVALPTALFTGVPIIDRIFVGNLSNGTKVVAQGNPGGPRTQSLLRPGGGFGGSGPLAGTFFVNWLSLSNVAVPLGVIGNTGASTSVVAGSLALTLLGTGWTTGPVTLTGLTTDGANTVTFAGYDNRTPGHRGVVQLISPFKVITSVAGNLPGLASQTLVFVPEPGALLLLASGVAGILIMGWRRRRK